MMNGFSSHYAVIERASYSISGFGQDAQRVPEIVTRMALSDVTLSSAAVLKSVIALASFHRDNTVSSIARPKAAALRALSESTQGFIGVTESACHIAAGIILCTLEVRTNWTFSDIDTNTTARFSKMQLGQAIGYGKII